MRKNQTVPGTLSDWLRKHSDKHKDRESVVNAAQEEFPKKDRAAIIRRINELAKQGAIKPKPPTEHSPRPGRKTVSESRTPPKVTPKKVPKRFRMAIDIAQVQDEYDDEGKIDEGIENLGQSIIKDNDFRIELGIAQDRWKLVSSLEKYTNCKIELRGKQFKGVYWGQQKVLAELRKKIDMT